MLIVGLTGGIGAGKSTLSEALARRGAVVIDVDGLGRQVIGHGGTAVEAVIDRFGEGIRSAGGDIDRAKLAEIVFADEESLTALNEISHPAINDLIDKTVDDVVDALREQGTDPASTIFVLDLAVLVESSLGWGNRHRYELVITVEAPTHLRLKRLQDRGMTIADAEARIAAQATDEDRRQVAQFVVTNGGQIEELSSTAGEIWAELQRLHAEKMSG